MFNHVDQTGFAPHRAQMKQDLLRMMGKVGVVGVLELISEIAEESAQDLMQNDPATVNFWQMAAAHSKELSERLWNEHQLAK